MPGWIMFLRRCLYLPSRIINYIVHSMCITRALTISLAKRVTFNSSFFPYIAYHRTHHHLVPNYNSQFRFFINIKSTYYFYPNIQLHINIMHIKMRRIPLYRLPNNVIIIVLSCHRAANQFIFLTIYYTR